MKTRAAIYARLSTQDQAKGTSHGAQIESGRKYAESRGYEVVAEELDVISGTFILARTAFNAFLEMMSDGPLS